MKYHRGNNKKKRKYIGHGQVLVYSSTKIIYKSDRMKINPRGRYPRGRREEIKLLKAYA